MLHIFFQFSISFKSNRKSTFIRNWLFQPIFLYFDIYMSNISKYIYAWIYPWNYHCIMCKTVSRLFWNDCLHWGQKDVKVVIRTIFSQKAVLNCGCTQPLPFTPIYSYQLLSTFRPFHSLPPTFLHFPSHLYAVPSRPIFCCKLTPTNSLQHRYTPVRSSSV